MTSSSVARLVRMSPGLSERYRDEHHCLLWRGNVQFILSREAPSLAFMKRIVAELEVLAHQSQTRTGAILIIRSDARPPCEDARRYIADHLRKSSMAAAAQVVLGTGFQGAAMRSILTLIQTVSRVPYPMKVFSEPAAGALWLSQQLHACGTPTPAATELSQLARDAVDRFLQPVELQGTG